METMNPLVLPANAQLTTKLSVLEVTGDTITVEYRTMQGNQPNDYGNLIAVWENFNNIPWDSKPTKVIPIKENTPHDTQVIDELKVKNNSYIIGYSVGPILQSPKQIYGNICATAYVPAIGEKKEFNLDDANEFAPTLTIKTVGSSSVSFYFELPDGVLPLTNGAWAGFWRGNNPSFYGTDPIASTPIKLDVSSGTGGFNSLQIQRGQAYTIGLFMSGYKDTGKSTQRALACSVSFQN